MKKRSLSSRNMNALLFQFSLIMVASIAVGWAGIHLNFFCGLRELSTGQARYEGLRATASRNGCAVRSQKTDLEEFYPTVDINANNLENLLAEW